LTDALPEPGVVSQPASRAGA